MDEIKENETKENSVQQNAEKDDIGEEKKDEQNTILTKKIELKRFFIVFGIIAIAVFIIIILIALPDPAKYNSFDYHGFKFEKVLFGNSLIYESNMTLYKNNRLLYYNLRLRNDPRALDKISANFTNVPSKVYLSFTPETLNCSDNALISVFQIGQYLTKLGINVTLATTEDSSLNNSNISGNDGEIPVKNCSSKGFVLMLMPYSDESRIYQENKNCIVLEAKNCSTVEVSERFIMSLLEKYKVPEEDESESDNSSNQTNASNISSNNS